MTQIVVPYRGENGKQRLETSDEARSELSLAMLGDVLAAATVTGRTLVVTDDKSGRALAAELGAIGYVEAEDGTTNALALPAKEHFAPLYGGGSAARFRDHADSLGVPAISCAIPNLSDDVDTLDDLGRIGLRAGPRTQAAIGRALQP